MARFIWSINNDIYEALYKGMIEGEKIDSKEEACEYLNKIGANFDPNDIELEEEVPQYLLENLCLYRITIPSPKEREDDFMELYKEIREHKYSKTLPDLIKKIESSDLSDTKKNKLLEIIRLTENI